MAKYAANGATISVETNAIGNIVSFGIPSDSADEIDVSSHASQNRDFVSGLINTDDMTLEMVYDPATATFVITLSGPAASHIHTFEALLKGFSIDVPHDGALTASATIKRVGADTISSS